MQAPIHSTALMPGVANFLRILLRALRAFAVMSFRHSCFGFLSDFGFYQGPNVGHYLGQSGAFLGQSGAQLGHQNRQKADYFAKNAVLNAAEKMMGHLGHLESMVIET